jgi:hypothetical protein
VDAREGLGRRRACALWAAELAASRPGGSQARSLDSRKGAWCSVRKLSGSCATPRQRLATPPLSTAAAPRPLQVLNYGQSIFEGLKAYRASPAPLQDPADGEEPAASAASSSGRVLLFRPDANAARFAAGAARMCMPPVPPEVFMAALHAVVRANQGWVSLAAPRGRLQGTHAASCWAGVTRRPIRPSLSPSGAARVQGLALPAAAAAGHGPTAGPVPRALVHLRGVRSARGRTRQGQRRDR